MIELKQVEKYFADQHVLHGINVTLGEPGITAVIGGNGAGKSTLLNVMARLIKPDAGAVWLNGQPLASLDTAYIAKHIAILTQSNHLQTRLTVSELVSFGRFAHHQGRPTQYDHAKIHDALAYLELLPLADRYLDQLSGGQRQRAFIAMVLAQDTQYVLLDEPLNNLDMLHSKTMMQHLRGMADDFDKRIIMVMHDINFASVYSDQMIAMRQGRILYQAKVSGIMQPKVLKDVFGFDMHVQTHKEHLISLYYD